MSPLLLENHPLYTTTYAIGIYATMLMFAFFLVKFKSVSKNITTLQGRYGCLDGLRGVLAAGVFITHSFTAYGYFIYGDWKWSQSNLLNHLGQTTVALFFMITGFLFALKSTSPNIDWKVFYIHRLARLFPLYATIVCIVFFIVFFISDGILKQSGLMLLLEFIQWLSFVCFGRPDINALPMTWTMIAGVNWSLKYEVIFYVFAVPILHFLSRFFSLRTLLFLVAFLLLSCFILRLLHIGGLDILCATHFLSGIVIAYAYKEPRLLKLFQSHSFRMVAGASVLLLFFLEKPLGLPSTLIIISLFCAVIGGLSVWGLLNTRAALWLGDISYGIYLIHGLVLWLTLTIFKTYGNLPGVDIFGYGGIISLLGVFVVALASPPILKLKDQQWLLHALFAIGT
ncbi:MAG: acyltransferase family protein [Methylococcaceae bacterium]